MPTQQTETITDETLEEFIKKTKTPKQTHHLSKEQHFSGAILDKYNPHFFPAKTNKELYNEFNKEPSNALKEMLRATENPIAISTHLMNGAYNKLTNPTSPHYLPHTKAQYHINHAHTNNPTLSLYETDKDYNVIIFNEKDLENF